MRDLGTVDKETVQNLRIEEKAPNLALNDYSETLNTTVNIDEFKKEQFNIQEKAQGDKLVEDLVNNLHLQVKLEGDALEVNKDAAQKYSEYTKEIEKNYLAFQKGLEIVQKFQQKQNKQTKRTVKPSKKEETLALNKETRRAIKLFYEAFDRLSGEEKNLLTRFNQISGKFEKSKNMSDSAHKLQDVLVGLKRIGWEKDKVELVSRSLNKRRFQPSLANWYGWGSWSASPWKYFFDSAEDWKSKLSDVEGAKAALERYLKSKRGCVFAIFGGQWGVNRCYSEKSKYDSKIIGAEEAISLHIAAWMMKRMNLIH